MSDKRKRSTSIKEILKADKKDKKCPQQDMEIVAPIITDQKALATREDMERVITQIAELRGYIVRLHDMCLQAAQDDSLEEIDTH